MSFAASVFLFTIHALHQFFCFVRHAWNSLVRRNVHIETLGPLSKKPKHLGVVLAQRTDFQSPEHVQAMIESACLVTEWCSQTGVANVSVYDRTGTLMAVWREVCDELDAERVEREALAPQKAIPRGRMPLTPPPSDHSQSGSRGWSPEREQPPLIALRYGGNTGVEERGPLSGKPQPDTTHTTPVTLRILSRDSGKPQLAAVAQRLAGRPRANKNAKTFSVTEMDSLIFEMAGLPEVDLIIVHPLSGSSNWPLELHGFPPWQMRLAEIYHDAPRPFNFAAWWTGSARPLSEDAFCRALRMFGRAEQRVGT